MLMSEGFSNAKSIGLRAIKSLIMIRRSNWKI